MFLCLGVFFRLVEGTNTSHLDKVQHGYENMEHFKANFDCQRKALAQISFRSNFLSSIHDEHP